MAKKQKVIVLLAVAAIISAAYSLVLHLVVGPTAPQANQMSDAIEILIPIYLLASFLWLRRTP